MKEQGVCIAPSYQNRLSTDGSFQLCIRGEWTNHLDAMRRLGEHGEAERNVEAEMLCRIYIRLQVIEDGFVVASDEPLRPSERRN